MPPKSPLPSQDSATLLFANETFYRAFADRDYTLMTAVWADGEDLSCLHPGWPPLQGREAVLQSWHAILTGPSAPNITPEHPKASLHGDCGIVVCYEQVDGEYLIATNIFVRAEASWLLVHHQSGPTEPPSEAPQEAPRMN